jgi:hypothetical protein
MESFVSQIPRIALELFAACWELTLESESVNLFIGVVIYSQRDVSIEGKRAYSGWLLVRCLS